MRKIKNSVLVLLICVVNLFAEITEIKDLVDVQGKITSPSESIVLFDIDYTLLRPPDQFSCFFIDYLKKRKPLKYRMFIENMHGFCSDQNLSDKFCKFLFTHSGFFEEPNAKKVIRELQDKCVLGCLTSRSFSSRMPTMRDLRFLGFSSEVGFWSEMPRDFVLNGDGYSQGVLYCAHPKGLTLAVFLSCFTSRLAVFRRWVVVDDNIEQLKNIEQHFDCKYGDFLGLYYPTAVNSTLDRLRDPFTLDILLDKVISLKDEFLSSLS